MKIIHVVSGLTKGGGERVVAELANKAVESGDEITIIAGWKVSAHFLQDTLDNRIAIKFIAEKKYLGYINMIPWILKNKDWLRSNDILHCHLTFGEVFGTLVYFLLRNKQHDTPKILETYHAVGMKISKVIRYFHKQMIRTRDGVVFMANDPYWDNFTKNNPGLKKALIRNGIALINPTRDENLKEQFCRKNGIPKSHKFIVGTISMLRPDRRPAFYVPITEIIAKEFGKDVHFVLGGDGSEREKIEKMIASANLKEIFHLIGLVSVPANVMTKMDIYVSISVGKITGLSMIEAAMCKVPVLGIQLLDDYDAKPEDWVWSHQDLTKVAEKIIFLLTNENERNALAEKQYQYVVDNFSSDAMQTSYKTFYQCL